MAEKKKWPRYRGYSRLIKSGNSGSLSVGSDMMSVLTEGLLFKPELTKDGILFRITDEDKMTPDDKPLPTWVKSKPKAVKAVTEPTGPIPAVNDEHPDNDLSDEVNDADDAVSENVEDDGNPDEPPTDDDTPF